MTDLFALTYVSETARDLSPDEIDALLLDARAFNASVGVTGALFHGDDRFFQLIEGRQDDVLQVLERIRRARAHHRIELLSQGPVAARFFETWHMGFVRPPATAVQELAQLEWEDAIPYTRQDAEASPGISQLLYHWNRWAADMLPVAT